MNASILLGKKLVVTMLLASFVLTPLALVPQKVFAAQSVIEVGTVKVESIVTAKSTTLSAALNTLMTKFLGALEIKEYILDGILNAIVKKLAQQMVKSIIAWVKSGFQGSPMFVTDPGQFLLSAGDQVAREYIYGSLLSSMPNDIVVRSALDAYYRSSTGRTPYRSSPYPTSGSFGSTGGWDGWLSRLSNPNSVPMAGLLTAQADLDSRILGAQSNEKMKWDWGSGFLASEECTTTNGEKTCRTVTPGETIAEAINFNLSVPGLELIEADEINEIISALLSQLMQQALTAAGGLFGLGNASLGGGYSTGLSGGSQTGTTGGGTGTNPCASLSYIDQIGNPLCDGQTDGTNTVGADSPVSGSISRLVGDSVRTEDSYQSMQQSVSGAAATTITDATQRGDGCGYNTGIISEAQSIRADANANIVASNLRVQELLALQATSSNPEAVLAQYNALATSGEFRTEVSNIQEATAIQTTMARINTLQGQIRDCPVTTTTNNSQDNSGGGGN